MRTHKPGPRIETDRRALSARDELRERRQARPLAPVTTEGAYDAAALVAGAPGQVALLEELLDGPDFERHGPRLLLVGPQRSEVAFALARQFPDQRALRCLVNMLFPSTDYGWVLAASVVQSGLLDVISEAVRALVTGQPSPLENWRTHELCWELVINVACCTEARIPSTPLLRADEALGASLRWALDQGAAPVAMLALVALRSTRPGPSAWPLVVHALRPAEPLVMQEALGVAFDLLYAARKQPEALRDLVAPDYERVHDALVRMWPLCNGRGRVSAIKVLKFLSHLELPADAVRRCMRQGGYPLLHGGLAHTDPRIRIEAAFWAGNYAANGYEFTLDMVPSLSALIHNVKRDTHECRRTAIYALMSMMRACCMARRTAQCADAETLLGSIVVQHELFRWLEPYLTPDDTDVALDILDCIGAALEWDPHLQLDIMDRVEDLALNCRHAAVMATAEQVLERARTNMDC